MRGLYKNDYYPNKTLLTGLLLFTLSKIFVKALQSVKELPLHNLHSPNIC
jgi:hypothetical protein